MKKVSILLVVALMAIISSCGGNENKENNENSEAEAVAESYEDSEIISNEETPEIAIDTEQLKELFQTTKLENIHIVKYRGTLGDNHITLQLQNKAGIPDDNPEVSLYMYNKINNPLKLKYDNTKNYICLNEQFPKKKGKGYKKGGTLSFKNNKKLTFEMTGKYVNPKGTKTYPIHLQAVEIITKDQKDNFEELQEYRTDKHYFTVESAWGVGFYDKTIRFVKQINVYDKKTNKKLQSLPVPFGEYYSSACVEPTNTKPNGIQIGCCPNGIVNPNGFEDYIAFLLKNGRYKKDANVKGHKKYERGELYCKYDKNGDIIKVSTHNEFEYFEEIIYVTSDIGVKTKTMWQNLREYRCAEEIVYDAYDVEILTMPECGNPVYKRTIKKDKQGKVLSCKVKTNYPQNNYKLSADGKTLLECNVSFMHFDLNGQEDLRKVEKIASNAFGINDDEEENAYMSLPFSITLNPNFKTIPKAIRKYEVLEGMTSLAPDCLQKE